MEPGKLHEGVMLTVHYSSVFDEVAVAEVANDLRILADKAFPELNNQANAKDQLTLDCLLSLLDNPKIVFAVR